VAKHVLAYTASVIIDGFDEFGGNFICFNLAVQMRIIAITTTTTTMMIHSFIHSYSFNKKFDISQTI